MRDNVVARFLALLSVCAALATPCWAQQPQDLASRSFAAGTAAYAEKDYLHALSYFQDARDAGLKGPAVHYNIAVCDYRLGEYDAAAAEFSLIAEQYPAMRALAQYNLGLVAQKQGDGQAASRYFRLALADSDDEKIQRLAAAQLESEPVAEPARWYSLLDARLGYDDNVRLVSNDVPLPSGQSAESMSTEFWGLISGPLSAAPGFRFDGNLYSVRYQDASFYDQNYLSLGAVCHWQWNRWVAEAGPQLSFSTLDGDGYEKRAGVAFRVRRYISSQLAFGARLTHDEVNQGSARFVFVAGSRDWLELSLDVRNAENRLTFIYALESNDQGANIASTRHGLSLRYRHPFNVRWLADVQGSFRRSAYNALTQPHDEDLTELSFGLTRSLAKGWEVTGNIAVSKNSAIDPLAYDRNRVFVSMRKSLQ